MRRGAAILLAVLLPLRLGQYGLRRTPADTYLARGAVPLYPLVLVLTAEGQILDAGEDRRQANPRAVLWGDDQAVGAHPAQPGHLCQGRVEGQAHSHITKL